MTERDVAEYRTRLQTLAGGLSGKVATLERETLRPTGTETMGGSSATADGEPAEAEDIARIILGKESQTLADVNAALDRIERDTFGHCDSCQRPIAKARLDVVPFARQCIACARQSKEPRT
jgi:DnaK suppressor protein